MRRFPRPREARWVLGTGLLATLGSALALWPLPQVMGRAVTPDPGDPLLVASLLAHGAQAVARTPQSIFDANFLYPASGSLAFTESFLGISIPLAPVFWLTQNPALLLNVAVFTSLVVSSVGAHLLLTRLGAHPGVAMVGGLAFALMPYRLLQVGHLHVLAIHFLPFVLLAAMRLQARPGPARAAVLAAVVAAQMWSSLTAGALALVALACWCAALVPQVRTATRAAFTWGVLALAMALVLSGPLLATLLQVRLDRPESEIAGDLALYFSAAPGDYLASTAHPSGLLSTVYAPFHDRARDMIWPSEEKLVFPGLWALGAGVAGLVVLGGAALRRPAGGPADRTVATLVLLVVVGAVLSLGPKAGGEPLGAPLPGAPLFYAVPALRVPARFALLTHAGLVFLGALLLDRASGRLRTALVTLSVAVLLLDAWPGAVRLADVPAPQPAHRALASGTGPTVSLPLLQVNDRGRPVGDTFLRDVTHMYLSTAHFRPLVNGYAQFLPREYLELAGRLQDFPSAGSVAALREQGVGTVVVQTDLLPGTPWADVQRRLAAYPGIVLVDSDPGVRVYELQPRPRGKMTERS